MFGALLLLFLLVLYFLREAIDRSAKVEKGENGEDETFNIKASERVDEPLDRPACRPIIDPSLY